MNEPTNPKMSTAMAFDDDAHSDCLVLVERLRALCDPFADPPWAGVAGMTVEGIRLAVRDRFFQPIPFSSKAKPPVWRVEDHIARIAYLVVQGWDDPIEIDVGVPALNCWVDWPVTDGNHRLAAAIVRGDEVIRADLTGSCEHMVELFGETPRTRLASHHATFAQAFDAPRQAP